MKTFKPLKLGVLTRTFELDHKHYFVPTVLVLCDFGPKPRLHPDMDLWRMLASELGKEAVLDECMPKPRGEVLAFGKCFTAGGAPRTAASVRVRVGPIDKSLYVIGDRVWRRDGTPSDPEPFTEMPITWARAFGGEGFPQNPVGIGFSPVVEDGRELQRLPNVEDPSRLVTSRGDRPAPAGLAPYDLVWPQRWSKIGTYDAAWAREQLPGFARDMDLGMWNAAPPDQQREGYFEGTEELLVENMHPQKPRLEGRLPGLVGRVFVTQRTESGEVFKEISTRLDTVQIFPHLERCVLSFRGLLQIAEDDADDIVHLMIACDAIDARRPLEHYRQVLARRLDPARASIELLRDEDLVPPELGASGGRAEVDEMFSLVRSENILQRNLAERARRETEKARAAVAAAGGRPEEIPDLALPEPPDSPGFEDVPRVVDDAMRDVEEAEREAGAAKARAEAEVRKNYAARGLDYDAEVKKMRQEAAGPPKFSAERELERLRDIQELCRNANVSAPELDEVLADPETERRLREAEAQIHDGYRLGAHLAEYRPVRMEEPARSELRRLVGEAHARGESLARQDYSGADLSGMDLQGADLEGSFLENAILSGTRLSGACLSRAVLAAADLSGADLEGADLSEANVGHANLRGAKLEGARLEGAILSKSDLTGAALDGIVFELADLSEMIFDGATLTRTRFDRCVLRGNQLRGCDFREATLVHSVFVDADLRSANFSSAKIDNATFMRCNMDGAIFVGADGRGLRLAEKNSFVGADLRGAKLEGATLREADFTRADLSGAELSGAELSKSVLRDAKLYRVVAKNTVFIRADLTGASLVAANLEGALLLKAKLARADFKGANLFRADLLRAAGDAKTRFTDANLKHVRASPKSAPKPTAAPSPSPTSVLPKGSRG